MTGGWNTIIGAVIATAVAFLTAALALLMGEGVSSLADISQLQWVILGVGALLTFFKDFQAIWTRKQINKVTGTGDGGGAV